MLPNHLRLVRWLTHLDWSCFVGGVAVSEQRKKPSKNWVVCSQHHHEIIIMDRPTSEYELFRAEHLSRLQQETDRMGSDPTALFLYHTARDKKLESPLETSAKLIEDTPYSIGQGQDDQEMGNRLELQ